LKQIRFPVPSLPLQKSIVQEIESKFSVIDKVQNIVEESLKKAEKLKKSILKSAFEGRLVKDQNI
jgi:type I restriction enzyme S subunit